MIRPLEGLRVVQLGRGTGGGYCAKLFAQFGAEVVIVDAACSPLADMPATRVAYQEWLDTNKRHLEHSYGSEAWPTAVDALLGDADLIVDARATQPGASSENLIGADLSAAVCTLSWFGRDGPRHNWAGADLVVRSMAGLVHLSGPEEGPPTSIADFQVEVMAGVTAFTASLASCRAGERARVDVSIHEVAITFSEYQYAQALAMGPARRLGINRYRPTFPVGVYPCRNGWIGVTVITPAQWIACCELLDMPERWRDPSYLINTERMHEADEIEQALIERLQARDAGEWFDLARCHRLPWILVPRMKDILESRVFERRAALETISGEHGTFKAPAAPFGLGIADPAAVAQTASRKSRVSGFRPRSAASASGLVAAARPKSPLEGLRIVDLSMGWAGPLATRQLGDLGAEIIKIEACQYPDWWRGHDPRPEFYSDKRYEKSPWFNAMNRNKRGVTLDLSSSSGAELLKRLVRDADAVVENYAPDVLPKLGLGYETLRAVSPGLVMLSMPAFSSDSDWADVRAYGSTLEQAAGLPWLTGGADQPPIMNHLAYGDANGGLNGAAALLLALLEKRRTGEGRHIDLSQVEAMLPLAAQGIIAASLTGEEPERIANGHPWHAPWGMFECAGDDGWVAICVETDAQWQCLRRAMGIADDPRFELARGRCAHRKELAIAIGGWTKRHDAGTAAEMLQAAGVPAGRSVAPLELAEDVHLIERGFWQPAERAFSGMHLQASAPFRFQGEPIPVRTSAPTLGQDNKWVLSTLAGLDGQEMERLESEGVIGTAVIPPHQRRKSSRQAAADQTETRKAK